MKDEKSKIIEAFVTNAVYLAKLKGTLTEFEKYCGVSSGYFSRRTTTGITRQGALSLQTALLVSEYLDRSIEELCNPNLKMDLEAKRVQQQLELIEQTKLSLQGDIDEKPY